ncbi:hypothetical protein D3C85_1460500 [compost metagenome]
MNIPARRIPIIMSVAAAFLSDGLRKLGIAFDIASTPVKAEQPELNAFSRRNKLTLEIVLPNSGAAECAPPEI